MSDEPKPIYCGVLRGAENVQKTKYMRRPEAMLIKIFEDGTVICTTEGKLDPEGEDHKTVSSLVSHFKAIGTSEPLHNPVFVDLLLQDTEIRHYLHSGRGGCCDHHCPKCRTKSAPPHDRMAPPFNQLTEWFLTNVKIPGRCTSVRLSRITATKRPQSDVCVFDVNLNADDKAFDALLRQVVAAAQIDCDATCAGPLAYALYAHYSDDPSHVPRMIFKMFPAGRREIADTVKGEGE